MAKRFFADNGVAFEEKDASTDEFREELVERSGQLSVPVIIVDGEVMVGYNEGELRTKLGIGNEDA